MQTSATYPHLQFLLSEVAHRCYPLGVSTYTQRQGFSDPWGKGLDVDAPHMSSPLSLGCPTQQYHFSLQDFLGTGYFSGPEPTGD